MECWSCVDQRKRRDCLWSEIVGRQILPGTSYCCVLWSYHPNPHARVTAPGTAAIAGVKNIMGIAEWETKMIWKFEFCGGNVVHVLFHFFLTAAHFFPGWPLVFVIFSPLLQINVCSSNKNWLLISCSSSPLLFFSLIFAGLSSIFSLFSVFLFLYIPICGHDN